YIGAERLAAVLKGTWGGKGNRGTLTVGARSAPVTRNQARVVVAGTALTLDTATQTGSSGWLISEDFLGKGLSRLAPGGPGKGAARPRPAAPDCRKPGVAAPPPVPFGALRLRSYPSFTRIVIEAASAVGYAIITDQTPGEIQIRLPGLRVSGPQLQTIDDGLVKQMRLEPTGAGAVLRIALDAPAGQIRGFSLQDPFRIVLDIYRPKESAESSTAPDSTAQPLRLIVLDAGHG